MISFKFKYRGKELNYEEFMDKVGARLDTEEVFKLMDEQSGSTHSRRALQKMMTKSGYKFVKTGSDGVFFTDPNGKEVTYETYGDVEKFLISKGILKDAKKEAEAKAAAKKAREKAQKDAATKREADKKAAAKERAAKKKEADKAKALREILFLNLPLKPLWLVLNPGISQKAGWSSRSVRGNTRSKGYRLLPWMSINMTWAVMLKPQRR